MHTARLLPESAIDYPAIIESLPTSIKLEKGMRLLEALSNEWFIAYKRQMDCPTHVIDKQANVFFFMFDLEG
jgi:hypothetical protein